MAHCERNDRFGLETELQLSPHSSHLVFTKRCDLRQGLLFSVAVQISFLSWMVGFGPEADSWKHARLPNKSLKKVLPKFSSDAV